MDTNDEESQVLIIQRLRILSKYRLFAKKSFWYYCVKYSYARQPRLAKHVYFNNSLRKSNIISIVLATVPQIALRIRFHLGMRGLKDTVGLGTATGRHNFNP